MRIYLIEQRKRDGKPYKQRRFVDYVFPTSDMAETDAAALREGEELFTTPRTYHVTTWVESKEKP